jgi:hypothetical protein
MVIDYSIWSDEVVKYLSTSILFVKKNAHVVKQLTAPIVLMFILEDHRATLSSSVDQFYSFQYKVVKQAITGVSESGPFYSDKLVHALHSSTTMDGSLSLSRFTTALLVSCGGKIVKPLSI